MSPGQASQASQASQPGRPSLTGVAGSCIAGLTTTCLPAWLTLLLPSLNLWPGITPPPPPPHHRFNIRGFGLMVFNRTNPCPGIERERAAWPASCFFQIASFRLKIKYSFIDSNNPSIIPSFSLWIKTNNFRDFKQRWSLMKSYLIFGEFRKRFTTPLIYQRN